MSSGTSYIDSLLPPDEFRWNFNAPGTPLTVTYGFMTGMPWYVATYGNESGPFQAFTAAQRDGVSRAVALFESVANVHFGLRADGDNAQIRFGSAVLLPGEAAHTYYPEPSGDAPGDIWFNSQDPDVGNQSAGTYGFMATLHEMGHALGLKHSFFDPADPNLPYLLSDKDNRQYTVMSYSAPPTMSTVEPSSLMLYDIAALQYLYGANTSYQAGNTNWRWNANETFRYCIWDGGGIDTLDASNQTRRVIIDLNPGSFSSLGSYQGGDAINNLSIAYNCWIENAIGGSGNDTITGNQLANRLEGGAGDDTFKGGGGGDTFIGGSGFDTVSYQGANQWEGASDLLINLATGVSGGAAAGDSFSGIEQIIAGPGQDTLIGDARNNRLYGGNGLNTLNGGAGADYLDGGFSTADRVTYETSSAGVYVNLKTGVGHGGDAEGDTLVNFEDLDGSPFDDTLIGNDDYNLIRGGAGNDYMDGGGGFDSFGGGAGDDIYVTEGTENVYEDPGNGYDEVRTTANFWLLSFNVEKLVFIGTGDFEGRGTIGNETLIGGAGNDRLRGYLGDDILDGRDGSDTAVYSGNRSDYIITRGVSQVTVSDTRGVSLSEGTDTLFGIEFLQFADGTAAIDNHAPTVTGANRTAAHGTSSFAASALISVGDLDGDSISRYRFFDGTIGNGRFALGGTPQAENINIEITSAQLANLQFTLGAPATSDVVWAQVFDGFAWSNWISFTVTASANVAPIASVQNLAPGKGTAFIAASGLVSVSDPDDANVARYQFFDSTMGNGRFQLNGQDLVEQQNITVEAADFANFRFHTSTSGSDLLWVRAFDGTAWGAWKSFTVAAPANAAPVVTINPGSLNPPHGTATMLASSFFSVTDADNDTITQFRFFDGNAGNGRFELNGAPQVELTNITINASDLANFRYRASATGTGDTLWVQAFDGTAWGAWKSFNVAAPPNAAPVVTINPGSLNPGHGTATIAAASFFSTADADNDTITQFRFFDGNAGNGRFELNGNAQVELTNITIDASDLANFRYRTSTTGTGDTLWVQAFDGTTWGAWKSFNVAPQNTPPVITAANRTAAANTSIAASGLFLVADGDNDTITKYQFWDSTPGGGAFRINGVAQASNANIDVMANLLGVTDFLSAGAAATDQLWARAYDGTAWGEWKPFTITTLASS